MLEYAPPVVVVLIVVVFVIIIVVVILAVTSSCSFGFLSFVQPVDVVISAAPFCSPTPIPHSIPPACESLAWHNIILPCDVFLCFWLTPAACSLYLMPTESFNYAKIIIHKFTGKCFEAQRPRMIARRITALSLSLTLFGLVQSSFSYCSFDCVRQVGQQRSLSRNYNNYYNKVGRGDTLPAALKFPNLNLLARFDTLK